jgi:hypothetical protein
MMKFITAAAVLIARLQRGRHGVYNPPSLAAINTAAAHVCLEQTVSESSRVAVQLVLEVGCG